MNVATGFVYLKNILNSGVRKGKNLFNSSKEAVTKPKLSGDDIIAQEMKMTLVKSAQNYVEPLQKEFKCTKDMFRYAKKRCLDGIAEGYEHAVVMDAKNNKIIAEFKGEQECCSIKELKGLKYESDNIVLMHGHPENFPLSSSDVGLINTYGFNKVIAISPEGEFSLVSKQKNITQKKYRQAVSDYMMSANEDSEMFNKRTPEGKEKLKTAIHCTLREYTPMMGYRYVTNYSYLKNKM